MAEKTEKYFCFDCGKEVLIKTDSLDNEIVDGVMLKYEHDGESMFIIKCNSCYAKSKELTNFQECEVYSRVVGYLRPVKQWNLGKQDEYKDRKNYEITKTHKVRLHKSKIRRK